MIAVLLTWMYVSAALLLALYTLGQLVLLIQYLRHRTDVPALPRLTHQPGVTIQLPIYNEQHVVSRLLNAVAKLDYPRDRLHIQVLDDSTDATHPLLTNSIARLQRAGFAISHVRRPERTGYKAGALAYGLALTGDDFVLILDADFVPPRDFLRRTLPHLLAEARIGVVQTRWSHLNPDENWLTQAQRLAIDSHFVIEQTARSRSGWLIPFNGTGGIWRRACIEDAGGWQSDTLTEDLDLSYRAQLKGWRSLYLPEVAVPGELPPQLAAYRQQQARWAVGSIQCLLRLGRAVFTAHLPFMKRLMALHHLCQYLPHPLMILLLLLTPPLLLANQVQHLPLAPLGLIGLVPPFMYAISQRVLYPDWRRHLLAFPVLALLATGLAWSNTRAVVGAFLRLNIPFERTPKFVNGWQGSGYALRRTFFLPVESVLALYALWGMSLAAQSAPTLIPYLLVYLLAFGMMTVWTLRDAWLIRRQMPETVTAVMVDTASAEDIQDAVVEVIGS